jgi:uncharacterized protein YukJ
LKTTRSLVLSLVFVALFNAVPARAALKQYGVVVGKPVLWYLYGGGNWPHYHIKIDIGNNQYYDVAADLFSLQNGNGIQVAHREIFIKHASSYNGIFQLASGWHPLPFNNTDDAPTSGALDFMRHDGILSDIDTANEQWDNSPLIVNQTSVPTYDNLMAKATKVYVFGEPYLDSIPQGYAGGVHDVHQNQGDAAGSNFQYLDGVWQDGGIIVEYPTTGRGGLKVLTRQLLMTRFQVQSDFADDNGVAKTPTTFNMANGSTPAGGITCVTMLGIFSGETEVQLTNVTGNPQITVSDTCDPLYKDYYRRRSPSLSGTDQILRDYVPLTWPFGWPAPKYHVYVYANGGVPATWTATVKSLHTN